MHVKIAVAITDNDWFDYLSERPYLTEVNFWSPSALNFRALRPGELLLFKLKRPRNVIAGGGVFAPSNIMPCSLAWKAFGEANGASSLDDLRRKISRNMSSKHSDHTNFQIGCRILTQPFYLSENEWLPTPSDFQSNIMRFKTYSTEESEARALWDLLSERVFTYSQIPEPDYPLFSSIDVVGISGS